MAWKDCPAFNLNCRNCGIKGHLEKVCRQARNRQQSSSSNATHCQQPDPLMTPATVLAAQCPNNHPESISPDGSYVFAMTTATGSQKAVQKCRHRQRQRQCQREKAEAKGLGPNAARKIAISLRNAAAERKQQQAIDKQKVNEFVRDVKKRSKTRRKHTSRTAPIRSISIPHMEWNGEAFAKESPASPPTITIQASIMQSAHKSFGI